MLLAMEKMSLAPVIHKKLTEPHAIKELNVLPTPRAWEASVLALRNVYVEMVYFKHQLERNVIWEPIMESLATAALVLVLSLLTVLSAEL
jgi:hypothetical protein